MACRFTFFALFVLSALSCSDEAASQDESESRTSTWEYKAEPGRGRGTASSSWKAIPQTNNQLRLSYGCGFKIDVTKEAFLLLQFAASPSLVTQTVKGLQVAKTKIVWGQWDDLEAMTKAPPDLVYLLQFDKGTGTQLFRIRSRALDREADQRLLLKLQQYEVFGIGLKFYGEDFRIRNEAVLVDLAGASAAIDRLPCASD